MARAAVKAKQAQRAKAAPPKQRQSGRRRHASGGNPNQDLFFIRIRRKQRWVFLLLAVLFALTFAFLGVGSGSGSGLDQLFNNINIFGGHNGPSVSSAQKEIQKHPTSAKGYRDLATAFEAKGDTGQAITALQQYTGMKPKDAAAWSELAGLQSTQAQGYLSDYQNAYLALQAAAPSQSFVPTSGKLATVFSNPIENAQRTSVQSTVTDLQQKVGLAYNGAVGSWQHVTGLQPKNLNAWFQLAQAAQTAGNTTTAVAAYKKYLKLDPTSTSAPQIRALIKQLSPAPPKKKK
jgi:tetratricopeptide (TPR) repeat protein